MSCNCKIVKNGDDIDRIVVGEMENKKLTFLKKIKVSILFARFYFYFVATSIMNLMVNDKLEPEIPTRLLKKFSKF